MRGTTLHGTLHREVTVHMRLRSLTIRGFRSIDGAQGVTVPLAEDVTILLGANGAGKSAVPGIFTLLSALARGELGLYTARYDTDRILHYGRRTTSSLEAVLRFGGDEELEYTVSLVPQSATSLCFRTERLAAPAGPMAGREDCTVFLDASGHSETSLRGSDTARCARVAAFLAGSNVFHFHNISASAPVRDRNLLHDARALRPDAGNLAAFVARLRQEYPAGYRLLCLQVRAVCPQFRDVVFRGQSAAGSVSPGWLDSRNELCDELSDGTLRFTALAALLSQPVELMPGLIILDEPELGLHPMAISMLAGMILRASQDRQVLLATQSQRLLNEFSPESIRIVEWEEASASTVVRTPDVRQLQDWCAHYSLAELWEKNVFGGQP